MIWVWMKDIAYLRIDIFLTPSHPHRYPHDSDDEREKRRSQEKDIEAARGDDLGEDISVLLFLYAHPDLSLFNMINVIRYDKYYL